MKENKYQVTFRFKGTAGELVEEVCLSGQQDKSQKAAKVIVDKYRGKGQKVVIIHVKTIQTEKIHSDGDGERDPSQSCVQIV